ncbi:hypothetical protein [Streptomyces sp. HUAS TT7]|uniref:hypothetical protein n=1 Tax=Streptomyces sp. HUAS TT7 TaxID=3447507 RepID=UPI003F658AB6
MTSVRAARPLPHASIGYRIDGRPVLAIGATSSYDPSNQPSAGDTDCGTVALPQHELSKVFAKEKDQGRRAGVRDLLGQLGQPPVLAPGVMRRHRESYVLHRRIPDRHPDSAAPTPNVVKVE